MDLRTLPEGLTPEARCAERKRQVSEEVEVELSAIHGSENQLGQADEKNCENCIGLLGMPIGIAGPLTVNFSSKERLETYLPLATTEAALVASVNRGCKALEQVGGCFIKKSVHHGITRTICFNLQGFTLSHKTKDSARLFAQWINEHREGWTVVAEGTSSHLKVLSHDLQFAENYAFLTIAADTGEAMGMNMVTIAAQAVADFLCAETGVSTVTIAANVDSDKKPSQRTKDKGRGYEVTVQVLLPSSVLEDVLKSNAQAIAKVAHAKLELGSALAGSLGTNLHAANIVAALYIATGQDAAHAVEGSLTETSVEQKGDDLLISVRCPAVLVGVRGGGTALPGQSQLLNLILEKPTSLTKKQQLAETITAAVLAGEISLLAAQAAGDLAKAHKKLAR